MPFKPNITESKTTYFNDLNMKISKKIKDHDDNEQMIAEMWEEIQQKKQHDKRKHRVTDSYLKSLIELPSITGDLPLSYLKEYKEDALVWSIETTQLFQKL